jgi:endonuclease/exonuclease/phosphatase family metal-dependent hydrolase
MRTAPAAEEIRKALPGYDVIVQGELVTATRLPVRAVSGDDDRKFLRVDMEIDGNIVSFYNVHVSMPFGTNVREIYRRRQQQLQALREDLDHNPNEAVISGDFNATTTMGVMDWFFRRYQDSASASRTFLPVSWGYHRLPNLRLWRLDYAFLDRRLTPISHESVKPFESDHSGQRVTFTLSE